MARERYLVGVSKEELEYKPHVSEPMTPKGWFSNFWYHYKWVTIGAVFAVIVLTVLLWQTFTREKPDYQLCLAVEGYVPEAIVEVMEAELEKVGTDLNGDGEVMVTIQNLNIADGEGNSLQIAAANRQVMAIHIGTRDVVLFAMSKDYYESLLTNLTDGVSFLHPLETAGTAGDGTYFEWDVKELLPKELQAYAPDPLIVGVRAFTNDIKEADLKKSEEALQLLKAYLTAKG
ncbi:MAG: hypothetical protein IKA63_04450 [Clostridia bacterium]|nr:hypothetical protein [Clostridia bacterium]